MQTRGLRVEKTAIDQVPTRGSTDVLLLHMGWHDGPGRMGEGESQSAVRIVVLWPARRHGNKVQRCLRVALQPGTRLVLADFMWREHSGFGRSSETTIYPLHYVCPHYRYGMALSLHGEGQVGTS
jgi:hypothetical protein